MDINKDCFLDMDIDERIEAYFTGEKVHKIEATTRRDAKDNQGVSYEERKLANFD